MKNRLKRKISAIIICACLLISVVSVVGAANAAVPTAEVAAGEGNFIINGGFEADSALLSQSGEITLGWKLGSVVSATPALSNDSYEGEQSLELDLSAADAAFTLVPSIADDNGKITNLKAGIYNLSFYAKGNAALSVKYLDAELKECTKTFNSACENITEWTQINVPMGLGTTGRLQFTITPAEGTAAAGQSIFIDNVALRLAPSVINGEFEREVTVPSTAGNLIADGDFENGTINALSSSGDTVLLDSENGYGLKAYSYAGVFAEANTNAQYVHSGTRSLKIYTNVAKSKQYISIAPEGATVKHGTKDVYFFENLESGTYAIKAYVKVPYNLDSDSTNDTRILARTFDWSTGNAVDSVEYTALTPDSNGWCCYEIDATVGEDGYLGFSLYITAAVDNSNTNVLREIYIDDFSITRKPPKEAGLITNGDFESGSVNALKSSVSKMNVFNAGNGYGLNAHTYTGMITELNTDSQYAYSGNRSLKIATDKNKEQQYIAIAPEAATEKHATKDVYFCKNVASGTYTVKFYAKIVGSNTNLTLYSFDWSTGNKLAEIKKSGLTPDANGWYCYETDVTVKADGYLGVKIYITAGSKVDEAVYIDDISILEKTETETETVLITNGDFEEGTVSTDVFGKIEKSGKYKIFTAADGSELATGYHFTTANYSRNNGKFAISTTEHFSGSRSLKFYSNTTDKSAATIIPEIANVHKNNRHYISGLEAGKYIFKFSFKDEGTGQVHFKSRRYSDDTDTHKLRLDDNEIYPADSNGWKTFEQELTVEADGYLNVEIYVGDVTDTVVVYLDAISLTKKVENNLVTNGSFETGTVYSGMYAKAERDTRRKIFVGSDGTTQLDTGYHFVAVDWSNANVNYAIDTANFTDGSRSLRINGTSSDNAAVTINTENANVYKEKHYYYSGLAAGTYTLSFSFKETNNVGRVHVRSYRYSDNTSVVNVRVDNNATTYPADSNGWKHYTEELTVGNDGYLNFEIFIDNLGATDYTYVDNIRLISDAPQNVTPPAPTVPTDKDTDIPYWTTMADDAGKSVLSIVSDDTVSGNTALKITQDADKSIVISPKITKTSIDTGYNMLAFHAKGSGSIAVKIETDSDNFEDNITLEDSWNMYRIRDIEIKESESVKKISFNVTGTALMDAVQFYVQAGPALLTESFTVMSGSKSLCMPATADGYKVALKSSSNADVISLDGKITEPEYNTAVEVVLSVTNINDSTDTADSHVFTVNVAGRKGQKPATEYKQMTLTDSQTGVSVSAVMNPDSKFRAMAIASDNRYYEEMLSEDMQSIAVYNTVLTPKGEHSSRLRFNFPVDQKYNGKTITVAYKGDGLDVEHLEVKAENGFVTVETDDDGFFMLQIPVEKSAEAPSQGTTEKPADKAPDEPSAEKPADEPQKEPSTDVEQTDKQLSLEKFIDNTLIWIVIIVAVAAILIIVEITTTLLIKRKIKRF